MTPRQHIGIGHRFDLFAPHLFARQVREPALGYKESPALSSPCIGIRCSALRFLKWGTAVQEFPGTGAGIPRRAMQSLPIARFVG